MAREVARIAESKSGSYLELIRRLNERGYRIDLAELLAAGGREIPVAELQKKAIFDYMAAKGYVSAWSEAKLLVREDPRPQCRAGEARRAADHRGDPPRGRDGDPRASLSD